MASIQFDDLMSSLGQLQAYENNQIATTDPGTILLMGTIDSLRRAKKYMIAGKMADKGKQLLRANDFINQFLVSLDYEVGGELAHILQGLYRSMLDQILLANVKNEPQPLDSVISLLLTLQCGWEAALVAQRKKAAQAGT